MTTPTPGGNNRRRNGQRQNALNQQLKDVVDQMKTASQMLQQASSDVTAIAHNADQAFKSSNASIQMLAMQMQAMAGGQYGPITAEMSHQPNPALLRR